MVSTHEVIDALRKGLSASNIVSDAELLASHASDSSTIASPYLPRCVVRVRTTQDVSFVLRVASELGVPVVPRGAGSGLAGGANAVEGCIVLSTEMMREIKEIDARGRVCVVEPGVITGDLSRVVRAHGLHYPPDPASAEWSTIGGNIATNAGGLCCVRYGTTSDYVHELEVVLMDGTIARLGHRTTKGVCGYDTRRLFAGSEGTLGVVTEATLRLVPIPGELSIVAARFDELASAGGAVESLIGGADTKPSLLEIIDQATLEAIDEWKNVGIDKTPAMLMVGVENGSEAALAAIESVCSSNGAVEVVVASTKQDVDLLLDIRKFAYPALERLGRTMLEDVCVPTAQVSVLLQEIARVASESKLLIGVFGHAGDGNMHPTVVFQPGEEELATRAFERIMDLALNLGGTITGEHGVGILKPHRVPDELDEGDLMIQNRLKKALDPSNLMNPGKALPHPDLPQAVNPAMRSNLTAQRRLNNG